MATQLLMSQSNIQQIESTGMKSLKRKSLQVSILLVLISVVGLFLWISGMGRYWLLVPAFACGAIVLFAVAVMLRVLDLQSTSRRSQHKFHKRTSDRLSYLEQYGVSLEAGLASEIQSFGPKVDILRTDSEASYSQISSFEKTLENTAFLTQQMLDELKDMSQSRDHARIVYSFREIELRLSALDRRVESIARIACNPMHEKGSRPDNDVITTPRAADSEKLHSAPDFVIDDSGQSDADPRTAGNKPLRINSTGKRPSRRRRKSGL